MAEKHWKTNIRPCPVSQFSSWTVINTENDNTLRYRRTYIGSNIWRNVQQEMKKALITIKSQTPSVLWWNMAIKQFNSWAAEVLLQICIHFLKLSPLSQGYHAVWDWSWQKPVAIQCKYLYGEGSMSFIQPFSAIYLERPTLPGQFWRGDVQFLQVFSTWRRSRGSTAGNTPPGGI